MKTKIVFDANVYLAAAAVPTSYAARWLRSASRVDRPYYLFISEPVLEEVTLKLQTKFRVVPNDVIPFTQQIRTVATVVEVATQEQAKERDRSSEAVLACAVAAKADVIITTDRELLERRQYQGIGIYHPSNLRYLFPKDFERAG